MLLQMQFFHYLFRIWFFCFFNNVISNILNIFKYIEDLPCFSFFGGGGTPSSAVCQNVKYAYVFLVFQQQISNFYIAYVLPAIFDVIV